MTTISNKLVIPDDIIMRKIYFIRGQKIMLDRDLAELYGVETKRLKGAGEKKYGAIPKALYV